MCVDYVRVRVWIMYLTLSFPLSCSHKRPPVGKRGRSRVCVCVRVRWFALVMGVAVTLCVSVGGGGRG